jgi:hypothetical protein
MSVFGMIRLYFSEEVTITLKQYRTVLKMLEVDGAIVHTACKLIDCLRTMFWSQRHLGLLA